MEKWVCTVCGYVYNPAAGGDPDNGVAPGTAFEDVPMIGYVLIAEWARTSLKRRRRDTVHLQELRNEAIVPVSADQC